MEPSEASAAAAQAIEEGVCRVLGSFAQSCHAPEPLFRFAYSSPFARAKCSFKSTANSWQQHRNFGRRNLVAERKPETLCQIAVSHLGGGAQNFPQFQAVSGLPLSPSVLGHVKKAALTASLPEQS